MNEDGVGRGRWDLHGAASRVDWERDASSKSSSNHSTYGLWRLVVWCLVGSRCSINVSFFFFYVLDAPLFFLMFINF